MARDDVDDRILLDIEAQEYYATLDGPDQAEIWRILYQLYEHPELDHEGRYLALAPPEIEAAPWPLLCLDGDFVIQYEITRNPDKKLVIVRIRRRKPFRPPVLLF